MLERFKNEDFKYGYIAMALILGIITIVIKVIISV